MQAPVGDKFAQPMERPKANFGRFLQRRIIKNKRFLVSADGHKKASLLIDARESSQSRFEEMPNEVPLNASADQLDLRCTYTDMMVDKQMSSKTPAAMTSAEAGDHRQLSQQHHHFDNYQNSNHRNHHKKHERSRLSVLPLFVSTSSERSSSAPTSPLQPRLGERDCSGSSLANRPCPPVPNQPPPLVITRANRGLRQQRKHGLRHTNLLNGCPAMASPYQSDVSQSAPSSPSTSCYDRLPLVKYAAALDETEDEYDRVISSAEYFQCDSLRNDWSSNFTRNSTGVFNNVDGSGSRQTQNYQMGSFPRPVRRGPFVQDKPRTLETMPESQGIGCNYSSVEEIDLLLLLQRLGLENLHACLVQNGYSRIDQLDRLTRQTLIDMGVLDAEARASLLTAAQLLTDKSMGGPICLVENAICGGLTPGTCYPADAVVSVLHSNNSNQQQVWSFGSAGAFLCQQQHRTQIPYQRQQDSGFYSGNDVKHSAVIAATGGGESTCRMNASGKPPLVDLFTGRYSKDAMCQWFPFNPDRGSRGHQDRCLGSRGHEYAQSPTLPGFESYSGQRKPANVGQNSDPNDGAPIQAQRSLSLGPKPNPVDVVGDRPAVNWLADDICLTVRNSSIKQKWVREQLTSQENSPFSPPKTPVGILRKVPTSSVNDQSAQPRKRPGSTPKSVKIDETSLQTNGRPLSLEHQLTECLRIERIDLTKPPYSNESGESGIPLRLIERYANEMNQEFNSIALTLEIIRERKLREADFPLISNLEEIHSQRYLNCNGIKTDNISDFLTSIGLPMYAECLSAALNGQSPTPGNLMVLSDAQMVYSLGIPVSHVSRIRQEASLIPRGLLGASANTTSLLHQKNVKKASRLLNEKHRPAMLANHKQAYSKHQQPTAKTGQSTETTQLHPIKYHQNLNGGVFGENYYETSSGVMVQNMCDKV